MDALDVHLALFEARTKHFFVLLKRIIDSWKEQIILNLGDKRAHLSLVVAGVVKNDLLESLQLNLTNSYLISQKFIVGLDSLKSRSDLIPFPK